MFTVTCDKQPDEEPILSLNYLTEEEEFGFTFTPEKPAHIALAATGTFHSPTGNGYVTCEWTADKIHFGIGKYGDGHGGSLNITVIKTPELQASFEAAIAKWNSYLGS